MNLPKDGTNQLSKAGFDWMALKDGDNELWREGFDLIALKVIVKVRKVRFGSFSHISLY